MMKCFRKTYTASILLGVCIFAAITPAKSQVDLQAPAVSKNNKLTLDIIGDLSLGDYTEIISISKPTRYNVSLYDFIKQPELSIRDSINDNCIGFPSQDIREKQVLKALQLNQKLISSAKWPTISSYKNKTSEEFYSELTSNNSEAYSRMKGKFGDAYLQDDDNYLQIELPACLKKFDDKQLVITPMDTLERIVRQKSVLNLPEGYSKFVDANTSAVRRKLQSYKDNESCSEQLLIDKFRNIFKIADCISRKLKAGETYENPYSIATLRVDIEADSLSKFAHFGSVKNSTGVEIIASQSTSGGNSENTKITLVDESTNDIRFGELGFSSGENFCGTVDTPAQTFSLRPEVWNRYEIEVSKLPIPSNLIPSKVGIVDSGLSVIMEDMSKPGFNRELFQIPSNKSILKREPHGQGMRPKKPSNISPWISDRKRDHGTLVSSLIFGGSTILPKIRAMDPPPINIRTFALNKDLNASYDGYDMVKGINYLASDQTDWVDSGHPISDIINISAGTLEINGGSRPTIDHYSSTNRLLVVAAGNGLSNDGKRVKLDKYKKFYPAAKGGINSRNIITVAAHDQAGKLTKFSNYGSSSVDIGAPGCNVLALDANGNWRGASGTSLAAPIVTFTSALLSTLRFGDFDPQYVKNRLILSADFVLFDKHKKAQVRHGAALNISRALSISFDVLSLDTNGKNLIFGKLEMPNNVSNLGGLCTPHDPGNTEIAKLTRRFKINKSRVATMYYSAKPNKLRPLEIRPILDSTCDTNDGYLRNFHFQESGGRNRRWNLAELETIDLLLADK